MFASAKKQLFELINDELKEPRNRYNKLLESPDYIESILSEGAIKAREYSVPFLEKINKSIGLYPLGIKKPD